MLLETSMQQIERLYNPPVLSPGAHLTRAIVEAGLICNKSALQLMIDVVDEVIDGPFANRGKHQFPLVTGLFPVAGWKDHCQELMQHIQERGVIAAQRLTGDLTDAGTFWIFKTLDMIPAPVDKWRIWLPITNTTIASETDATNKPSSIDGQGGVTQRHIEQNENGVFDSVDMPVTADQAKKMPAPTMAKKAPVETDDKKKITELEDKLLMQAKNQQLKEVELRKRLAALESENAALMEMGDFERKQIRISPTTDVEMAGVAVKKRRIEHHFEYGITAEKLDNMINDLGWEVVSLKPFQTEITSIYDGAPTISDIDVFAILRREVES